MTESNHYRCGLSLWTMIIASGAVVFWLIIGSPPAGAQQNVTQQQIEDPAIKLLVELLIDENTDPARRLNTADTLLQMPQAHSPLIDILRNGRISTRIIICQAIAVGPGQLHPFKQQEKLSQDFIDALFSALLFDNPELSLKAAQALARCHNGVPEKLAQIALDNEKSLSQRLAAIAALELIYSKKSVETLNLIYRSDDVPQIKLRAAQALARILYLPQPARLEEFQEPNLAQILKTDDQSLLLWLLDRKDQELSSARSHAQQLRRQTDQYLQKLLDAITIQFNSISVENPKSRLDFLTRNLLEQNDDALRLWAVRQIINWCNPPTTPAPEILKLLVDILKPFISDNFGPVREQTVKALEKLGEIAKPTAPQLLDQLTQEPDPQVQVAILAALGSFEYTAAADRTLTLLKSEQPPVVAQAARTLGKFCAAGKSPPSEETILTIARILPQCYRQQPLSTEIRRNLIFAMKNIAAQDKFRPIAREQFEVIIQEALKDEAVEIRREAIYALTEIYRQDVPPLLRNLLVDPEIAVRLDVLDAMDNYPRPDMLPPLRQQLAQEKNSDVAAAIFSAFKTILQELPMQDSYDWAQKLQNTPSPVEQQLFNIVVEEILFTKITEAQKAGQEVKVEYEQMVRNHQIEIARRNERFDQVINNYYVLLKLDIPEQQKDVYRRDIIEIALARDDQTLLDQGLPALRQLLPRDGALAVLQLIDTSCEQQARDNLPRRAAKIIAALIIPLMSEMPTPQLQTNWDSRRRAVALALIAEQQKMLGLENPQHDLEAIQLIRRLESRLEVFPAAEPPAARLKWLEAAAKIIQGLSTSRKL